MFSPSVSWQRVCFTFTDRARWRASGGRESAGPSWSSASGRARSCPRCAARSHWRYADPWPRSRPCAYVPCPPVDDCTPRRRPGVPAQVAQDAPRPEKGRRRNVLADVASLAGYHFDGANPRSEESSAGRDKRAIRAACACGRAHAGDGALRECTEQAARERAPSATEPRSGHGPEQGRSALRCARKPLPRNGLEQWPASGATWFLTDRSSMPMLRADRSSRRTTIPSCADSLPTRPPHAWDDPPKLATSCSRQLSI